MSTALDKYAKLEALARYFDGEAAQPRDVVLGFGARTLIIIGFDDFNRFDDFIRFDDCECWQLQHRRLTTTQHFQCDCHQHPMIFTTDTMVQLVLISEHS